MPNGEVVTNLGYLGRLVSLDNRQGFNNRPFVKKKRG